MAAQSPTRSADAAIWAIAARQHGVVARRQLLAAGVTRHQIAARLKGGRLRQLHRGVYLVGAVPPEHACAMAALLAFGAGSVLSHRSAGRLWQLLPYPAAADAWVTVPPGRKGTRPKIRIHRAPLARRDIRHRHGMALTSPPRTILDVAAELGDEDLERVAAEASYRRLASETELHDQLARNPGKHGVIALRRVLDVPGGPRRTRSPAERALLELLRENQVEAYETNATIHGYEVDFLWRDLAFAVEVDGYDAHSGRVAFERDRLKIAILEARGLTVMPVTGRLIRRDPAGVLSRLLAALERVGYRPAR